MIYIWLKNYLISAFQETDSRGKIHSNDFKITDIIIDSKFNDFPTKFRLLAKFSKFNFDIAFRNQDSLNSPTLSNGVYLMNKGKPVEQYDTSSHNQVKIQFLIQKILSL